MLGLDIWILGKGVGNTIQYTEVDNISQNGSLVPTFKGEVEQTSWVGLQFQMYPLQQLKLYSQRKSWDENLRV